MLKLLQALFVLLLPIAFGNANGQTRLPISIGAAKSSVVRKMQHHKSHAPSAAQHAGDSTGGWLIDSLYDHIRWNGISGTLSVTFDATLHDQIVKLHWECPASIARATKILRILKKRYGGELDEEYLSWGSETPTLLREAIYFQGDLVYRESGPSR